MKEIVYKCDFCGGAVDFSIEGNISISTGKEKSPDIVIERAMVNLDEGRIYIECERLSRLDFCSDWCMTKFMQELGS